MIRPFLAGVTAGVVLVLLTLWWLMVRADREDAARPWPGPQS